MDTDTDYHQSNDYSQANDNGLEEYQDDVPVNDDDQQDFEDDFYADEDPYGANFADPAGLRDDDHQSGFRAQADPPAQAQLCTVDSEYSVTCLSCLQVFKSNTKLYQHLDGCKPQAAAAIPAKAIANFANPAYRIIHSARQTDHVPGYAFRSWRYATATVGLGSPSKLNTCCLDSGCVMTLIDSKLAASLQYPQYPISPIPISRIGSQHLSDRYIVIQVYFLNKDTAAELRIEAHVVEDLRAQLLIGMDVLGPEGFILDFPRSQAIIESCENLTFPIALCAKPHHVSKRPVYASSKIEVPPRQAARIPIVVKSILPKDRDFVFEPGNSKFEIPAQMVDAGFAYIHAVNNTDRTQVIRKKDRVGQLLEPDFTSAYQVSTEVTPLASQPQAVEPRPPLINRDVHDSVTAYLAAINNLPRLPDRLPNRLPDTIFTPDIQKVLPISTAYARPGHPLETVLPNSIIIYGTPKTAAVLRDIYKQYNIWSNPSVIDIL